MSEVAEFSQQTVGHVKDEKYVNWVSWHGNPCLLRL